MAGPPVPFPLPISYGQTDIVKNSGGFLVNLEAEVAPRDARTPVTIRGTPGLALFHDTGAWPCVGFIAINNAAYLFTRNALYRVFPDGGAFKLGTVNVKGFASVSNNGLSLVVTDGVHAYSYDIRDDEQARYDTSAPFVDFCVPITDPAFHPSSSVTFLDARMIFVRDNTNEFFNTPLNAVTPLDANATNQAETSPDNVVAVFQDHQVLHVAGRETVEFWYDDGVPPGPYSRVEGGVTSHGIASPWCMAAINNNVFWLTPEASVMALQGYSPRPVSTPAIVDELKKRDLSTAIAFCYTDRDHYYYQLTVGDFTAVFDMSTQLWHRRSAAAGGRHLAQVHAFCFGTTHLIGSYADGKVYAMSADYFDEAGDPLPAIITTGPFPTGMQPVGFPQIEIEVDVGGGATDGREAMIGVEISRDDGQTWGPQRLKSLGALGKYLTRVRFMKNGSAYMPRFRFTLSDPVRRGFTSRLWVTTD